MMKGWPPLTLPKCLSSNRPSLWGGAGCQLSSFSEVWSGKSFLFFSLLLVNISIIDILCTHNAEVMGWDNTLLSPSLAPTFPSTSKAFDFQNTMLAFVLGIKYENRKYRFNSFKVLWLLFCARMNGPDKISLEFPFFPVAWLNRLFKFQLYMTLTICLICKRLSGIHIG